MEGIEIMDRNWMKLKLLEQTVAKMNGGTRERTTDTERMEGRENELRTMKEWTRTRELNRVLKMNGDDSKNGRKNGCIDERE